MRIAVLVVMVSLGSSCRPASSQEPVAPPSAEPKPAAKAEQDSEPGPTGALSEEAFKALHDLKEGETPKLLGTAVELAGGAKAYLSLPEGGVAPEIGLIVIHEWWGLNDHVRHWTDRLAALGYAALAVDLYGGTVATTRDQAMAAMSAVDDEAALKVLRAAHEFLVADPRVKAKKTGVIGWCFGGAWSLRAAMAIPELDAAVIYYGRLVTDAQRLKPIRAKVLGIFGERDASIPMDVVKAFEAALAEAGVAATILTYDAEHAFANPSAARYDEKSAAAAFERVKAFLRSAL
jgi:carboxymethylenebutenolidase